MKSNEELDIKEPAEALGSELRALRVRATLTVTELAKRCDMSASKLSRMELARIVPSESDVRKIAEVLGASPAITDDLASQAQLLRRNEFLHPLMTSDGDESQYIRKLERQATRIQSFELGVLPSFLQTANYMRVIADSLIAAGHLQEMHNGTFLVQRMERAALLMHPRKHFEFVLTWSALAMRHAENAVMAAQCDHLISIIKTYPNVRIGIISQSSILPYPVRCGFTSYNDRVVVTETFSRHIIIDTPAEVPYFTAFHEQAQNMAIYDQLAIDEIERIKLELYSRI